MRDLYGEADRVVVSLADAGASSMPEGPAVTMLRWALADGKPVLALGPGALAVLRALGGATTSDRPRSAVPDAGPLRAHARAMHAVDVEPASAIGRALPPRAYVLSDHHAFPETLPDGLRAIAWSDDGVVEGFETIRRGRDGWPAVTGLLFAAHRSARSHACQRLLDAFLTGAVVPARADAPAPARRRASPRRPAVRTAASPRTARPRGVDERPKLRAV
jgi:hypothetical protein